MRTLSKLFILALAASMAFTSCNKDEEGIPSKEPKFSKLSAEENKAELEKAGVALMNEMSGITETEAMKAADNLEELASSSDSKSAVAGVGIIKALSNLDKNATSLKAFMEETPLSDEIADIEGIYTWNPAIEEFDMTEATGKVVFKFPYNNQSTTNDCEFTATIEVVTVSGELTDMTEAPSNISASLTVKGKEVTTYSLSATYNEKGIPSNITTELNVDTYKWKFTASQNASSVSNDFLIAHGSTTLMNYGFSVGGNLDMSDIEAYAEKLDAMEDYVSGTITEGGEIVQDVKLWYQIMNIKLIETANTKEIAKKLDVIAANENLSEKETQQELVSILNSDNVNVYLMYADDNKKIADVTFYLSEYEDEYGDFNPVTMSYEPVTRYDLAPQFTFGKDESPVDAEVYFNTGFDEFDKAMTDMEDEIIAMFPDLDNSNNQEDDMYADDMYYSEMQ